MTAVHPPKVHLPDEDSATSKTTIHASKTGNRGNAKIPRLGQGLSGERVMPVFKKLPPRGSVRVRTPPPRGSECQQYGLVPVLTLEITASWVG